MEDPQLPAVQHIMAGLLFYSSPTVVMCNWMHLPYTALANSISSNYPVLVLHCKVPASNEKFAGGCYKALLLSPLFAGTLWWQLKRDGSDVVHMEGHDSGQHNRTDAFVQPGQEDSCAFSHPLFSSWMLPSTKEFQANADKNRDLFFFFFPSSFYNITSFLMIKIIYLF